MNLVRSVLSVFLLAVLGLSVAGWISAAGRPSPQMEGARLALSLCALAAIGGLGLMWSAKKHMPD